MKCIIHKWDSGGSSVLKKLPVHGTVAGSHVEVKFSICENYSDILCSYMSNEIKKIVLSSCQYYWESYCRSLIYYLLLFPEGRINSDSTVPRITAVLTVISLGTFLL